MRHPGAGLRSRQRGFSLIEIIIGGTIALLFLAGVIYPVIQGQAQRERGKTLATAVAPYHGALFTYALTNREALVNGTAVAGVGAPLAPTCAELRALLPALLDYSCQLPENAGTPTFFLTVIPTGCTGTACDVGYGVTAGRGIGSLDEGAEIVRAAVNHFGGEGGQSFINAATVIRGTGWQRANPLGNTPRVFGTYGAVGTSMFSQFVRRFDVRDPNFLGSVSIAQTLSTTGTITSVTALGAGDGTCQFAQLTSTGLLVARNAACVDRVVANGNTGTIETRDAAGAVTVRVDAGVSVFNGATNAGGFRISGGNLETYADQVRINSGSAGISATGVVYGATGTFADLAASGATTVNAFLLASAQTVNTACTSNSFARDSAGRWMECSANLWRYTGIGTAAAGAACSSGPFAVNSASPNDSLICRNNNYVSLNSALGLVAVIDSVAVVDGSVVAAPSCASGSTPGLMTDLTRIQTPVAGGATRVSYSGTGPWTISLTGAGGEEAEVWRVCRYASF